MRNVAGLFVIVLIGALAAGCGVAGDESAKEWTEFIRKHEKKIEDGSFNADEFKQEGKPIARKFAEHKKGDGSVALTEPVLKDLESANEDFAKACEEHGNLDALLAYDEVAGVFDESGQE